jgi:hypothetical protein
MDNRKNLFEPFDQQVTLGIATTGKTEAGVSVKYIDFGVH